MSYTLETCPDRRKHTACPAGYVQWAEWADRKMLTHKQVKCPTCGLYAIWVKMKSPSPSGAKIIGAPPIPTSNPSGDPIVTPRSALLKMIDEWEDVMISDRCGSLAEADETRREAEAMRAVLARWQP